jgi:hypothetical protein
MADWSEKATQRAAQLAPAWAWDLCGMVALSVLGGTDVTSWLQVDHSAWKASAWPGSADAKPEPLEQSPGLNP